MPVLPADASTTSPPGLISPRSSASRMIWRAVRSFTDWPGFMNSALPKMVHCVAAEARLSTIKGVLPMASTIPSLACIFLRMFERFAELARARLHLVEQPHVLDRDDRLVGESRDKLDFLLRKRPHYRPRQSNDPNRVSLSQERHTKHSAKGVKLDKFGHSVFRIALSVWNVNYLALKHGPSGQRSPIDRNGMLL